MVNKMRLILLVVCVFAGICTADGSADDYRLNDEVFGRGLIQRNLDDLWQLYDEEHFPTTDLQMLSRQIVQAFAGYLHAEDDATRAAALREMLALQQDRIASYSDHPLAAAWPVRLADDLLHHKAGGQAFVQLIGLTLPQDQQEQLTETLDQARVLLRAASEQLNNKIALIEKLPEERLDQISRMGLPEIYQASRQQARYLQTWINLHALLADQQHYSDTEIQRIADLADKLLPDQKPKTRGPLYLLKAIASRHTGNLPAAQHALTEAQKNLQDKQKLYLTVEQIQLALAAGQAADAHRLAGEALDRLNDGTLQTDQPRFARAALLMLMCRARLAELCKTTEKQPNASARQGAWDDMMRFLADNTDLLQLVCPNIVRTCNRWPAITTKQNADLELLAKGLYDTEQQNWQTARTTLEVAMQRDLPAVLNRSAREAVAKCCYKSGDLPQAVDYLLQAANNYDESAQRKDAHKRAAAIAWENYASDTVPHSARLLKQAAERLLADDPDQADCDRYRVLLANALFDLKQSDQVIPLCRPIDKNSTWYPAAVGQMIRALVVSNTSPEQLKDLLGELERTIASTGTDAEPTTDPLTDSIQKQLTASGLLAGSEAILQTDPHYAVQLLTAYPQLTDFKPQLMQRAEMLLIRALVTTATCSNLQLACCTVADLDAEKKPYKLPAGLTVLQGVCQTLSELFPRQIDKCHQQLAQLSWQLVSQLHAITDADNTSTNQLQRARAILQLYIGQAEQSIPAVTAVLAKQPNDALAMLTLALADYQAQRFESAAANSLTLLERTDSQQRLYWQALLINLSAHTQLQSPPNQICNAIILRQKQSPEMGGPAIKAALLRILQKNQQRLNTKSQEQ